MEQPICTQQIPNDEIWYTSTDGQVVAPHHKDVFGASIISNTYCDGKGIIKFDSDLTTIGDEAFYKCNRLYSIIIPESVTAIGSLAFAECSNIISIKIPDFVTSIGWGAFSECIRLTSVVIGTSVMHIGSKAFEGCTSLPIINDVRYADTYLVEATNKTLQSYNIKKNTRWIGTSAFKRCFKLVTIAIPDSVISIENSAFLKCSSLNSIIIPDSVKKIGNFAFFECYSLSSLKIGNSVTKIGGQSFENCESLTTLTVPKSVELIAPSAFRGCSNISTVQCEAIEPPKVCSLGLGDVSRAILFVPKSIKTKYEKAYIWNNFKEILPIETCTNNLSMTQSLFLDAELEPTIPNDEIWYEAAEKIEEINQASIYIISHTFAEGKGIIKFKGDLKSIGNDAFEFCSSLTSIILPNSVISIGDSAFYRCYNLTYIFIPNSVTSIGHVAFDGCFNLTSITIPNSVTSIGSGAFKDCKSLTSITIPNSVTSIGDDVFRGTCFKNEEFIDNSIYADTYDYWGVEICDFIQDNGLAIKNNIVVGYRGKPTSISIPNSVIEIGDGAFFGCFSLTAITIPNSVTSIGSNAFCWCKSLTYINIPNSVLWIGESAFNGCTSLPIIDQIHYADTYLVKTIDNTKSSYTIKEGTKWIGTEAFRGCANLTSITIPVSVISIGFHAFARCNLSSIFIPKSITNIGMNPFISNENLVNINVDIENIQFDSRENCQAIINSETNELVTGCRNTIIPNSVTSIGNEAFVGCSSLTSINIPNSVTSIGNRVFFGCSNLSFITIPNSVTSIGVSAFYECSSLASVIISNSVMNIRWNAFYHCSSLNSIIIPNSVTSIENDAFEDCSNLTSVTIGNSVTSIGECAFRGCSKVKELIYAEGIETVLRTYLTSIEKVVLPHSVTSIEEEAFKGCPALEEVYSMMNKPIDIPDNVFEHNSKGKILSMLHVPCGKIPYYKASSVWEDFVEIQEWEL